MKLSEMNSEQLARVMCDLTPLLCGMAEDNRIADAVENFMAEQGDGMMIRRGAELLGEIIPVMLKDHEDAFFRAAAILTGKSADVLRRQSGLATVSELRKCWEDDLALFFSCAGIIRQGKS